MTTGGRAAIVAALSSLAVIGATAWSAQGIYSDPALQLKTVSQTLSGESRDINVWVRPDALDLTKDRRERLIIWAPGTPFAAWPLMRAGLSPASAARVIVAAALTTGAIGWTLWFARFDLPPAVVFAWAVLLPWLRFTSNALFFFTAEILVFAAAPWMLLSMLAAKRRASVGAAIGAGFGAGLLYVVKYSAAFVSAGAFVWLAWRAWRHWRDGRDGIWPVVTVVAASLAAAVPVVALMVVNQRDGSANLVTASMGGGFDWRFPLQAMSLPALTAADLDGVLRYVLLHPVHGFTNNERWLAAIGLPGAAVLLSLVWHGQTGADAAGLSRAVLIVSILSIIVVWTISTGVSAEARHLASAGFCALPLALAEGRRVWGDAGLWRRSSLGAVLALYVLVPVAYGPVSVVAKIWRAPSGVRPGASGFYNPLLAERDAAAVVSQFASTFDAATDVWYVPEPMSALDFPGRAIVVNADFTPLPELRRMRFRTSHPVRVHVLLPPRFERNGKSDAIRSSFEQATGWSRDTVSGSQYDRWQTTLRPEAGH